MNARIKINTNQLNRSLAEVSKRVERVGVVAIEDFAHEAVEFAREAYANAEYDGENDIVVTEPEKTGARTVEFSIEGKAFPYIEFGSGVRAEGGTPKKYWFFSSKGRNITLKAGGAHAHNRYKRTTELKRVLQIEDAPNEWSLFRAKPGMNIDIKRLRYTDRLGDEYRLRTALVNKKVPEYIVDKGEKKNSYITKGNPPANVIPRMRDMYENKIHQQFKAKFK